MRASDAGVVLEPQAEFDRGGDATRLAQPPAHPVHEAEERGLDLAPGVRAPPNCALRPDRAPAFVWVNAIGGEAMDDGVQVPPGGLAENPHQDATFQLGHLARGVDAELRQPRGGLRPYSPQLLDAEGVQEVVLAVGLNEQEPIRFGHLARHLGQEGGASHPNRDRKADLPADSLAQPGPDRERGHVDTVQPPHVQERLVDRDALNLGGGVAKDPEHGLRRRHVGIEVCPHLDEIGAQRPGLATWHCGAHSTPLRLVARGQHNSAPDGDRSPPQAGVVALGDRGVEGIQVCVQDPGPTRIAHLHAGRIARTYDISGGVGGVARGGTDMSAGVDTVARVTRVAAIDCGTNTIRLLVADLDGDGAPREVYRTGVITRLGQGVDRTGELDPVALARTLEATRTFAREIAERGAEKVRFVATSATRDAGNRGDFADGVRQILGIEPEVIDGAQEAALSFAGAAGAIAGIHPTPYLVIDLGGGSTEIVLGTERPAASVSLDIGSVRLHERHLHSDPPTREEIDEAVSEIRRQLDLAAGQVPLGAARTLVGVAGTITTVTAHALRLPGYQRDRIDGATLPTGTVLAAAQDLLAMTRADRADLPYLQKGRVDVIGAGALIWFEVVSRVLREVEAGGEELRSVVTSERDILDGIALSLR